MEAAVRWRRGANGRRSGGRWVFRASPAEPGGKARISVALSRTVFLRRSAPYRWFSAPWTTWRTFKSLLRCLARSGPTPTSSTDHSRTGPSACAVRGLGGKGFGGHRAGGGEVLTGRILRESRDISSSLKNPEIHQHDAASAREAPDDQRRKPRPLPPLVSTVRRLSLGAPGARSRSPVRILPVKDAFLSGKVDV
ncbi:unnamed protein product [Pleuronectes platessa]|uniref:Uncharacterized protein n=1 Tax=Pleuronectes platessa TaxID=8262 RepID=A0A9N7YEZ4_PLEPL|nr:unnamed protein product [Pleuronectes platessa]